MIDGGVDVWVMHFEPVEDVDTVAELVRIFGVDEATAHQLVASTPQAVKRGASRVEADRIERALVSIGGRVELRPVPGAAATPSPAPLPASALAPAPGPAPAPAPSARALPLAVARRAASAARRGEVVTEEDLPEGWRRWAPGLAAVGTGVGVLVVRLALGRSIFLGTSSLFGVAIDAAGISALLMGGYFLVAVAVSGASGGFIGKPGALLSGLSFALAFAVNCAVGVSNVADVEPGEIDDAVTGLIDEGEYLDAAEVLADERTVIAGADRARVARLASDLRTAGALRVLVARPYELDGQRHVDAMLVELPPDRSADDAVADVYRGYLGFRADALEEEDLRPPADGRFWELYLSFDVFDE